ncbi:MAG: HAD-IC family P-type ATPase, partial [Candidatus Pacebacteria bacterium]|nr:HAD-IC family P-type ATPase [Candidatus Paceibacterota bacterium]
FRNGKKIRIDSTTIVIGDVVLLYEGDKVPADGILVDASELVINEAVLTGESVPVAKSAFISKNKISDVSELISHLKNVSKTEQGAKVFLGTVVVSGLGSMVVTAIGMQTEMGHIARTIDEQTQKKTPLEKRIEDLARLITLTVVILSVTIFILGIVSGQSFSEMFIISVALAVSAIPEGLIVALTAILAIGMHRILQRKALVRNLVATETLGTVTRVCVDKTGTLTLGKLEVTDTAFTDDLLAYKTSILANELRDPLEFARWKWAESFARKHASKVKAPSVLQEEEKVDERIPFSSERRFLAVRVSSEIFMVGAPETIVKHTTLSDVAAKDSLKDVRLWAKKGRRIIALAYRKCASVEDAKKVFKQLAEGKVLRSKFRWLGLMGFTDPVRKSVKAALQQAASAGISVTVITGDYTETALAVMKELGMDVDENKVISGQELEAVSDASLLSQVQNIQLFARTKPSQKLRIVKALQARGEVVAMMGDGVNDAPAIAAAEIGLVVGDASDIARESADIVLLDSNFATILAAVEEGRGIFANLRKILLFLLSDTFSEVILIMGSLLMGLPLAITAAQV